MRHRRVGLILFGPRVLLLLAAAPGHIRASGRSAHQSDHQPPLTPTLRLGLCIAPQSLGRTLRALARFLPRFLRGGGGGRNGSDDLGNQLVHNLVARVVNLGTDNLSGVLNARCGDFHALRHAFFARGTAQSFAWSILGPAQSMASSTLCPAHSTAWSTLGPAHSLACSASSTVRFEWCFISAPSLIFWRVFDNYRLHRAMLGPSLPGYGGKLMRELEHVCNFAHLQW